MNILSIIKKMDTIVSAIQQNMAGCNLLTMIWLTILSKSQMRPIITGSSWHGLILNLAMFSELRQIKKLKLDKPIDEFDPYENEMFLEIIGIDNIFICNHILYDFARFIFMNDPLLADHPLLIDHPEFNAEYID